MDLRCTPSCTLTAIAKVHRPFHAHPFWSIPSASNCARARASIGAKMALISAAGVGMPRIRVVVYSRAMSAEISPKAQLNRGCVGE